MAYSFTLDAMAPKLRRYRRWAWSLAALVAALAVFLVRTRGLQLGSSPRVATQAAAANSAQLNVVPVDAALWRQYVGFVAQDIQYYWATDFARRGQTYSPALLLLGEPVPNPAPGEPGSGAAALPMTAPCSNHDVFEGTAYCAGNQSAEQDLQTYRLLKTQCPNVAGAAQAYHLAHTLGHHVQHLMRLNQAIQGVLDTGKGQKHALHTRLELQADCLAGVWAKRTSHRDLLSADNAEAALRCMSSLKADVEPAPKLLESFTHASSRQRLYWFAQGFNKGELQACDTFAPASL